MEQYKESDWSSFSALSTELERLEKAISAEFEDDSDGVQSETVEDVIADKPCVDDEAGENVDPETGDLNALDNLFCIACDKTFKSMNAWVPEIWISFNLKMSFYFYFSFSKDGESQKI